VILKFIYLLIYSFLKRCSLFLSFLVATNCNRRGGRRKKSIGVETLKCDGMFLRFESQTQINQIQVLS
jgi:hypothetical protein